MAKLCQPARSYGLAESRLRKFDSTFNFKAPFTDAPVEASELSEIVLYGVKKSEKTVEPRDITMAHF